MKRLGRKIVSVFMLSALLTTSFSTSVFAAETEKSSTINEMSQQKIRNEVVEIVKNASSEEERDELLSSFLQDNPLEGTITSTKSANSARAIDSVKIAETVKVDDNLQIDFYSNGDFGIQELQDVGASVMSARAATNYTNTYRGSYTIKNGLGGKIVETYVKGYFTYDNTNTPKAYITDAGYSKGALIMWDCASWDEGTGSNSRDKVAYCYADAYYHWSIGAEVGGSGDVSGTVSGGITLQDCNVLLKLNCSKTGNVYSTVSIED